MLKVPLGHFPVGEYNVYVDAVVTHIVFDLSPIIPRHLHVVFERNPLLPLPNVTGTLTIDPAVADDNVTARSASVVLDGAAPVLVDLMSGTGTFACMVGQTYSITDVDTNVTGDSLPSTPPLIGTVPAFGAVPATPTGLAVTFAVTP